jgi:hypothetical protein
MWPGGRQPGVFPGVGDVAGDDGVEHVSPWVWRGGSGRAGGATGRRLRHQEHHGHAQAAEHLEVDPEVLEGEGDEQVGGAAEQEEDDPGQVQAGPDGIRQGQGVAHDAFDQHPVTDEVAAGEGQGEQPVDHRRFPFEEGFAVEGQGQAAEHQAGDQGQPLAFSSLRWRRNSAP